MLKKKGSSLIIVIIFMMFLMIVGSATITTTMMDYKARVNESQRIENLYGAESGLEIAYDILLKASDYAINEAISKTNDKVLEQAQWMTEDIDYDVFFKSTYFKALIDKTYDHNLVSSTSLPNGLVSYLLTNLKYPVVTESSKLEFIESGFNILDKEITISFEILDESGNPITELQADKDSFDIKVTSAFNSTDDNAQVGENQRKVIRTYRFEIPKYTQSVVNLYPVFNGKALTVDKNVYVQGNETNKAGLSIVGDVWIGGCVNPDLSALCSPDVANVSYGKYENGLVVDHAQVTLTGGIPTNGSNPLPVIFATGQTLALNNQAIVKIDGNVYGRNIYVGKKDISSTSTGSELEITTGLDDSQYDVVLSNDLAVNVSSSTPIPNSTILLDSFYGISDTNVSENDVPMDDVSLLAQESSSILVNALGAKVDILKEAYIGGVAFLDVKDSEGNKYQTGESVAVKPNYLAYSKIVSGFEDQVTFRYYNPLMLVENLPGSKANYFVDASGQVQLSDGGISLPTSVYSAGATVSKGTDGVNVTGALGSVDNAVELKNNKVSAYENHVLWMNGTVDSTLIAGQRMVDNQINWNVAGFNQNIYTSDSGTVILNKQSNVKIEIFTEKNSENKDIYKVKIGGAAPVEISDHVFLVTRGDLELKGNVNLTGNFVVGGEVRVGETVTNGQLNYDKDFMKKILAENKEVFENLFINSGKTSESVGSVEDIDFSATTIISKGHWELIK